MPQLPTSHIFISYSRRDDESMRTITFFLRDKGFKVWVDNEKLIPGTSAWEEAIENAIKNASAVIVILSPESKNSEWVRREITYADQFQKRVFPVLIKGNEEESLPLRLVTRQYVDLRGDEEAGLESLSEAITFHDEAGQTLEMKRPHSKQVTTTGSPLTPQSSDHPSQKWRISTGIALVVGLLGLAALWIGYRFTSSNQEEAIPEIAMEYLEDVEVYNFDSFDDPSGEGWGIQNGEIDNGVLEIVGNEQWDGIWWKNRIVEGNGVIVDFSFSENSTLIIAMSLGEYQTDQYHRFGLYMDNDGPSTDIYEGEEYILGEFAGQLTFEVDTIYSILIAILPDGDLLQVLWNTSDPEEILEYQRSFGESWAGLPWTFMAQAHTGTIRFDNFREISFSGAK
jgi:hypothetical protein